ncbi:MAG: hypothetical protein ACMUHX_10105 [bacterium]
MKKRYRFFIFFMLFFICPLICTSISYAGAPSPRKNISIETRWGYYVLDTPKIKDSVFKRDYEIIGGLKINREIFRQFLQVGLGVGYMRGNEPDYYYYNIPFEASVNIRLKFSSRQFIVPYIGGGADYSYFKQKGEFLQDPNNPEPGTIHLNRKGYHVNAGFQFSLNSLSPDSAARFDHKFGVNATYLTFEARYADLNNFDDLKPYETDMSGWFYYMGLLFEF